MNETRVWITDLLASFSGQENTLTIPRPYITITGSVEAGLLLNQIVYWSDRTKMDNGWFAKSYKEWEDEITLTKRQVSRLIPALQRIGVETKVRRFNGSPTLHWRINKEKFSQSIAVLLNNPKQPKVTLESDKMSFSESDKMSQSSTENTQKITTDTIKPKKSKQTAAVVFRQEWEANAVMGNVLLQAFGCDFIPATNQTKAALEPYLEAAKELSSAGATIEQIPLLKTYIARRAKNEEWSKYSVKTFPRYYTDFLKTQKKILFDDPAMDLSKPMPNILSKFQQDELERKARENHG